MGRQARPEGAVHFPEAVRCAVRRGLELGGSEFGRENKTKTIDRLRENAAKLLSYLARRLNVVELIKSQHLYHKHTAGSQADKGARQNPSSCAHVYACTRFCL